ncbi:hypothetical protein A2108_02690 [Candidatus Wolfebacteria bacterium GWA1_42_9]|uniref:Uncharacterized protein n=1 Tax=Candidatus Wolfebacteria bacterium GWA1_42_9 TaxID=1802553 RepID=A0A1F8DMM2_9BACT|nr:MAG: hypothetical protein A2108_02690 [Candidatus Wolfebacteria bacterium GWA1_42_9]
MIKANIDKQKSGIPKSPAFLYFISDLYFLFISVNQREQQKPPNRELYPKEELLVIRINRRYSMIIYKTR